MNLEKIRALEYGELRTKEIGETAVSNECLCNRFGCYLHVENYTFPCVFAPEFPQIPGFKFFERLNRLGGQYHMMRDAVFNKIA